MTGIYAQNTNTIKNIFMIIFLKTKLPLWKTASWCLLRRHYNIDDVFLQRCLSGFFPDIAANIHLFKFNNKNIRKRCEICSKVTTKTLSLTLNISRTVYLFLTLNRQMLEDIPVSHTRVEKKIYYFPEFPLKGKICSICRYFNCI